MLKLKNGQYKDILSLMVAYKIKFGENETTNHLMSSSITAGLQGMSAKDEREMMYSNKKYLSIINLLK